MHILIKTIEQMFLKTAEKLELRDALTGKFLKDLHEVLMVRPENASSEIMLSMSNLERENLNVRDISRFGLELYRLISHGTCTSQPIPSNTWFYWLDFFESMRNFSAPAPSFNLGNMTHEEIHSLKMEFVKVYPSEEDLLFTYKKGEYRFNYLREDASMICRALKSGLITVKIPLSHFLNICKNKYGIKDTEITYEF